jgi:hypothetical protein
MLVVRTQLAAAAIVPTDWLGTAALAFRGTAGILAMDLGQAPIAFRSAADALQTYASALRAAQDAARHANAAAADLNARSSALESQISEARLGASKGFDVEMRSFAAQADAFSYEAVGIRMTAAGAAEQARLAAQNAAAAFDAIASTAPVLRRAYARAEAGGYDPMASLHRGDVSRWNELVQPWDERCLTGPGGYTGHGGFITGPDGLDYPLVVPHLRIGDVDYNGNGNSPSIAAHDVHSLGGTDPGWSELYRMEGLTRVRDKPEWLERAAALIVGTNPNLRPTNAPFGADDYGVLAIAAGGAPAIAAERRKPRGPGPGPEDVRISSPTFVRVGGELVMVDRNASENWNREIRRSGITPNTRAQNAGRAIGALSLFESLGEGVRLGNMLDDSGVAAYQVVFEANDDGGRRAMLRLYQVIVDQEGTYIINPAQVSLDEDGKPTLDNILFHREPEIRPAGEKSPYIILQDRGNDE